MIILDTNALCEVMKPAPSANVPRWMAGHPPSRLFTTVITQAEILYGIELLPRGMRRSGLESIALAIFAEDFAERVLPFDGGAARMFAAVVTGRRAHKLSMSQADAQIAAIALSRGAAVATRNVRDFEHSGIELIDPFGLKGSAAPRTKWAHR